MKSSRAATAFIALILPATVLAQIPPNDVELTAVAGSNSIEVSVELTIGAELPGEWVGWVVDRMTLGRCGEETEIFDGDFYMGGPYLFQFTDTTALDFMTYQYRIWAVDAEGTRHSLPGYTDFPPVWYHIDYAALNDDGFVVEGTVVDIGYSYRIERCPDNCWPYLAFVSDVPPELAALAGSDQVVMIRGVIEDEFEGPYVNEFIEWYAKDECSDPTGIEDTTWGALKVRFR